MRNTAHRLHRARRDDHAFSAKGTARDAGSDIVNVVNDIRHRLDILRRVRSLHLDRHSTRFAQNQMSFDLNQFRQDLEHANAINSAGRSGNANDQSLFVIQSSNSKTKRSPSLTESASFIRTWATTSILSFG